MTGLIRLEAWAAEAERPAIVSGADQLCDALRIASGEPWQAQLRFRTSLDVLGSEERPDAILVSLAPFVTWAGDMAAIEQDLRAALGRLMALDVANTALLTVFRSAGRGSDLTERIRRLNLLACELSGDTGIGVIDLDASLAHYGARALQTDWRLSGVIAPEAAGHVIADALLTHGLDPTVPVQASEAAIAAHGGLRDLPARVGARLGARSPSA